jgi:peroxiredoxin Q/BCP
MSSGVKLGLALTALAALALAGVGRVWAGDKGPMVGDKAPTFESVDDQGKPWKSSDHIGKKVVVVYFYPADLTGGCTKQACGFRDDSKKLADMGVEVIGVSGDSVKNHQLFKKVHNLNFTLLADEDGSVAKKFGVKVDKGGIFPYKGEDGTVTKLVRGVTIARWTFVIDRTGTVVLRDTKTNAAQDSQRVLDEVKKLQK